MGNEALVIGYLVTVAIDRGLPAAERLIQNWKKEDPTLADWEKLAITIKDPRKELT